MCGCNGWDVRYEVRTEWNEGMEGWKNEEWKIGRLKIGTIEG